MESDTLIDRDTSWLHFNERVLLEAENLEVPLLERLKFLAIFSSNLDEFFKVRVSMLRQWTEVDKELRKKLVLKPNRQLKQVLQLVESQQQHFGKAIQSLFSELEAHGIFLVRENEFTSTDKAFLREKIFTEISKRFTLTHDSGGDGLNDGGLYFWVTFADDPEELVRIPSKEFGRFVLLSSQPHRVCYLDDAIRQFLPEYFEDRRITGVYAIKLSRDAELYLEDDFTDAELVEKIQNSLHKRSTGQPTRLLYDKNLREEQVKRLQQRLGLGEADMIPGGTYHHLSDFFGFPLPENQRGLVYDEMPPLPHPTLLRDKSVIDQVLEKDHLLHLPYQSFEVLERLIEEASTDERVLTIKMTLYRLARQSRLTDALLKALENGKQVVLFVEAQARFDEENNIYWGNRFREEGAEVIFSIPQIKVHSKICLIEGQFAEDCNALAYIGTGNFNSKTARLYTDHGLFTADSRLTYDLAQVFLVLQRQIIAPRLKELIVSPFTTRLSFIELIQKEIENFEQGKPAGIRMKMNSLEDSRMIEYLQKAHEKGVPIRLLVRGICRLSPVVKDVTAPFEITSVVDRFLEHGRVFHFENGGDPCIFIGSADWMTRNLDRRIEVIAPIYDPVLKQELEDMLEIQLSDNVKARSLGKHKLNFAVVREAGQPGIRSQYEQYEYLKNKVVS